MLRVASVDVGSAVGVVDPLVAIDSGRTGTLMAIPLRGPCRAGHDVLASQDRHRRRYASSCCPRSYRISSKPAPSLLAEHYTARAQCQLPHWVLCQAALVVTSGQPALGAASDQVDGAGGASGPHVDPIGAFHVATVSPAELAQRAGYPKAVHPKPATGAAHSDRHGHRRKGDEVDRASSTVDDDG